MRMLTKGKTRSDMAQGLLAQLKVGLKGDRAVKGAKMGQNSDAFGKSGATGGAQSRCARATIRGRGTEKLGKSLPKT